MTQIFKNLPIGVTFSDDCKKKIDTASGNAGFTVAHVIIDSMLRPVIERLSVLKPTWRFVGKEMRISHRDDEAKTLGYCLLEFRVYEDSEYLGTIGRTYTRNGYKISVTNHRIASKRERGNEYTTESADRAIARVRKEFGRLSTPERIGKAAAAAEQYMSKATSRHENAYSAELGIVQTAAKEYVLGPGMGAFLEYVQTMLAPNPRDRILNARDKAAQIKAEMEVLNDIRSRLGSKRAALVVRDFDQYIVRIDETVSLYDDQTLPEQLRGRLGLLKLVEKEHFVENAGCRVSHEVFVVLLDDAAPGDANNVSPNQGE